MLCNHTHDSYYVWGWALFRGTALVEWPFPSAKKVLLISANESRTSWYVGRYLT